jgi:hypothetical protein
MAQFYSVMFKLSGYPQIWGGSRHLFSAYNVPGSVPCALHRTPVESSVLPEVGAGGSLVFTGGKHRDRKAQCLPRATQLGKLSSSDVTAYTGLV